MNFHPHKMSLVSIFTILSIIISTVSPLSINPLLNPDIKRASPDKPRFVYGSASARNGLNPEPKSMEDEDTITLYKEDGSENLWCTNRGDIVRIIPVERSELEKLETPQFHEPSFLREDDSHKLCKHKQVRNEAHWNAEPSEPAAKKEAEQINPTMERKTKKMPLVKISEHSSLNDRGRLFGLGSLFGPSVPPPYYGPPSPYFDPYFGGPSYFGGPPPGPYVGPYDPYYPPYY